MRLLKELIVDQQRRGATIIFSTHVMAQAEELCEQIVMIHRGRKVLDEASSKLRRQYDRRTIRFEPLDAAADITTLRSLPGVSTMTVSDGVYELSLAAQVSPETSRDSTNSSVARSRTRCRSVSPSASGPSNTLACRPASTPRERASRRCCWSSYSQSRR